MSRANRRALRDWAGIAAVLITLVGLLYAVILQAARVDALAEALTAEQQNVQDNGGTPVAPDPEKLIADPEAEPPPGPPGPPGPGPSDEQVYAAVAAYLAAHPITPDGPSSAEIAAAVAEHLRDHPPGPTPEQVSAALVAYLTEHPPAPGVDGKDGTDGSPGPPGPAGPKGDQGDRGPPPSAEAIAAQVEQWMRDNPLPPTCPEGSHFEARVLLTLDGPPVEAVICVITDS